MHQELPKEKKHSRSEMTGKTFGTNEKVLIHLEKEVWKSLSSGDKDFVRDFNADAKRNKRFKTTANDTNTPGHYTPREPGSERAGQSTLRRVVGSETVSASSTRPPITFNLDNLDNLQE
ncbi:MAG: hypothetical protein ACREOZ_01950 [Gloeomargaritales cyanobacterium]